MVWGGHKIVALQSIAVETVVYFTPLQAIFRDLSSRLARRYGEGKIQITWLDH